MREIVREKTRVRTPRVMLVILRVTGNIETSLGGDGYFVKLISGADDGGSVGNEKSSPR